MPPEANAAQAASAPLELEPRTSVRQVWWRAVVATVAVPADRVPVASHFANVCQPVA